MSRFTIQGLMRVTAIVAVICAAVCDIRIMLGLSAILSLGAVWFTLLDPHRHDRLPTAPPRSTRPSKR